MSTEFHCVEDVLENYRSAVYEKNAVQFLSSYASDVHIYDCWGNWEYIGLNQWKQMIQEWFKGLDEENVRLKVDFDDRVIEENSNLAFVHCSVTYSAYNGSGEKVRQMINRFTFGLKKEKGSWAIVHEHSSLPIDMETGKGIFHLK